MKYSPCIPLAATLLLAGCGGLRELFPREDGGQTKVPGTYLDARISPGHRAHLALTGDQQLSCHDCHAIADSGFTALAVKPCAECHEAQQRHHHPFDAGVPMTCTSCHVFRSLGEAARIDKWGCRRCHVETLDGGAPIGPLINEPNPLHLPPHVLVHTKKCEACHRPHGSPFTKAADCGLCHDITVSHGKGEKALVADTCMACHPHHSKAVDAAATCTDCHASTKVPARAKVKASALFDKGHKSCGTCHKPHDFVAAQVTSCSSCHEDKPVLAAQQHGSCTDCHLPHQDRAATKTCLSCHTQVQLKHPTEAAQKPCLGCHPVHSAELAAAAPADAGLPSHASLLAVPCTRCHQQPPFDSPVVHANTTACADCHRNPHAGKPARDGLCQSCHKEQLTLTQKNRGHQTCDKCHAGLPHAPPQAPKDCLSCHPTLAPSLAGHAQELRCDSCHQTHSGAVLKTCTQCHEPKKLPGLHALAKHQTCTTCHSPHGAQQGEQPATCQNCHRRLSAQAHPTAPQQCMSCHLFSAAEP